MFSISTVEIYTGIAPRWIAYIGILLALAVLIGSHQFGRILAVLPVWVLLISVYILRQSNQRHQANVKTVDIIQWYEARDASARR